jgi:hypothetical protein
MSGLTSRRVFLRQTITSGLAGCVGMSVLPGLAPVRADETTLDSDVVRFHPEIEPLVRLLEETPQEELIELVGQRIRGGLSYRELLAALLLAGVRNVEPRPFVGFKFHTVLVVNSAHLASIASPDADRWLPILWAVDYFKTAEAQDTRERNWTMAPVDEGRVPPSASAARRAFVAAMDKWDAEAVDPAVAGLARSAAAHEVFELFFRYGARDFRDIGHKAIFVANSYRTLQCIGWRYAEPVLRSLAYALQNHEGQPNPATSDLEADRPWRHNAELARQLRDDWLTGQPDNGAVVELLGALRRDHADSACRSFVEAINGGVPAQSAWDAVSLAAAELVIRRPGILALHAITSTNALRYAFQTTADDDTRRRLLLQNVAFVAGFRGRLEQEGRLDGAQINQLGRSADLQAVTAQSVDEVFGRVRSEPLRAARRALGHLATGGTAEALIDEARRLVFLKGTNSHDYKFSSAVLEDYYHLSPEWRNHFLAASLFQLHGRDEPDNQLVHRIRAALG